MQYFKQYFSCYSLIAFHYKAFHKIDRKTNNNFIISELNRANIEKIYLNIYILFWEIPMIFLSKIIASSNLIIILFQEVLKSIYSRLGQLGMLICRQPSFSILFSPFVSSNIFKLIYLSWGQTDWLRYKHHISPILLSSSFKWSYSGWSLRDGPTWPVLRRNKTPNQSNYALHNLWNTKLYLLQFGPLETTYFLAFSTAHSNLIIQSLLIIFFVPFSSFM